jgi:hypothetical protein
MYRNSTVAKVAHLLRGTLIFFLFALTTATLNQTLFIALDYSVRYRDEPGLLERAQPFVHLYAVVFSLFIFYSMARAIIASDHRLCLGYVEDIPDPRRNTFSAVLHSNVFLLEWIPAFVLCLTFSAPSGLFSPVYALLGRCLPDVPLFQGALIVLIYGLLFGLLLIVAHRSAMKEWDFFHEREFKRLMESFAIVRLFKRSTGLFCAFRKIVLLAFLYPFTSRYLWIALLLFFCPIAALFIEEGIFWYIPTLIALLILIPIVHRYRRAMRARRALVKHFEEICREGGIDHTPIRHPVRSLFYPEAGADTTFTAGGVTYDVKIIPSINRHATVYFAPGHQMVIRHTFYFLRKGFELFHFDTTYSYAMEGDHKKLVVVCPNRARMFAAEGGQTREIDTGDTLYGYTIYTATGFVNAIDRNCLPK